MNLKQHLSQQFELALTSAGAAGAPAIVRQSGKPEFGHYKANGVMGAAKKLGQNPRELAEKAVDTLRDNIADRLDVSFSFFRGDAAVGLLLVAPCILKSLYHFF